MEKNLDLRQKNYPRVLTREREVKKKKRPEGGIRECHTLGTRVRGSGIGDKQGLRSPGELPHSVRARVQGGYAERLALAGGMPAGIGSAPS